MEQTKANPRPRRMKWPQTKDEFRAWIQKERRAGKIETISNPPLDSWEGFSNVLFSCRKHLKDLSTPSVLKEWEALKTIHNRRQSGDPNREKSAPWRPERYYRFLELDKQEEEVERRTQEGWEALKTDQNRQRVMKLLLDAVQEEEKKIEISHSLMKQYMKQEDIVRKKIPKAHKEAVEAGKKFIATLKTYDKAIPISHLMNRTPIPSDDSPFAEYNKKKKWIETIAKCLALVTFCVDQLQQIGYVIPPPIKKKGHQPGPLESKAKNKALLEIYNLFRGCRVSGRKAAYYAHYMLHAAGVESNFSPHGTQAKINNLLKATPLYKLQKKILKKIKS